MEKRNYGIAMAKGLLVSYLFTAAAILVTAFLMLQLNLEEAAVAVKIIYFLSCFAGAWIAGKAVNRRRFLWGLLLGTLYFLFLLVISQMGEQPTQTEAGTTLASLGICVAGGMAGGMFS